MCVDAPAQLRDACGELTGIRRHVVPRPLDADPTLLRLRKRQVEIADGTALLPNASLERLIHLEITTPLTTRSRSRSASFAAS